MEDASKCVSFEKQALSAVLTEAFLKRDGFREEGGCLMCVFHLLKMPFSVFCVLSPGLFSFSFFLGDERGGMEGVLLLSLSLIAACPTIAIPRLAVRSATIAVIRRIAIV